MTTKEDTHASAYRAWLKMLKGRIRKSQIKAALQVNSELLRLYWQMGNEIVKQQRASKWGDGFLKNLSRDLMETFPALKGFSYTNLRYMKQWYLYYNKEGIICQQLVGELDKTTGSQTGAALADVFFSIPWGHHIMIMQKCRGMEEATFYMQQTVANNWSRAVLEHQIELMLYDRQGKAITNFSDQLPAVQSDLAQQLTKDPYIFDFLSLREQHDERDLENHLIQNMTRFLLELGKGFCFYGKQVHLNVAGDDFYIDLLFYNVQLHCYVVVELKTVRFKPEHVGQLKFYVTAVDREIRTEHDNPTVGLLICKDKNDVVAEYTLSDVNNPIGISSYQVYDKLAEGYKASLPSIEEIEQQLSDEE